MQTQRLAELLKADNQEREDYDGAWFARVAYDVGDFNEAIYVIIPEFSDTHVWGPGLWMGQDGTTLPSAGDSACVMFDNRRNLWVTCWWTMTDASGEKTTPPPSTKPPPQQAPPATGRLKSVGGIVVEQRTVTVNNGTGEGGGGGQTVDPSIKRGVLHDTEGGGHGDFQGQADFIQGAYASHFVIGTGDGGKVRIAQFYPLGTSSDATAAHDFEIWCQIEIVAPSGSAANNTAGDWRAYLVPIKDALIQLMSASGVPMVNRSDFSNRGANWAQAGWFGHCDVPDNDHTDPGQYFPWGDYL